MTRHDKLVARVLSGRSDDNINFDELCALLVRLGFTMRIRGSHHVFILPGVDAMINLQRDGHTANSYQVRQVRATITAHALAPDDEEQA